MRASTPTDLSPLTHPRTKEEWQDMKSTKLDICIRAVEYYLAEDNRPPLEITDGELAPMKANPEDPHDWSHHERKSGLPPDKIVLFSNFPVNNSLIVRVSCFISHTYAFFVQLQPTGITSPQYQSTRARW